MENLADISLDLICALKCAPPGGYDREDIAAMENACWQTLMHGLNADEASAVRAAARRQLAELELSPVDDLPAYLRQKHAVLRELLACDDDGVSV